MFSIPVDNPGMEIRGIPTMGGKIVSVSVTGGGTGGAEAPAPRKGKAKTEG